ncbi:hypothetical protein [Actinoplanes xinjiangensis]|uniref:Uncharacterized protein n=1 Tax=Actinoplanes xinjiangensis TaxID=512350 RepID=A0A316EEH3_9ACTN|nr:hypothetical protein [Actinoplanes xinjiangensis]PWK28029.1 hypothetical protein BC793_1513 [Actinoplanes xinjiangensis]
MTPPTPDETRNGKNISRPADDVPRPGGRERGWLLLGRPWWQGVGAIAGGVGVVVTILVAYIDSRKDPDPPPANNINGNCNVQGDGQASCYNVLPPSPVSRAGLKASLSRVHSSRLLFAGTPDQLPTPPPYTRENAGSHCVAWKDFIDNDPRFYREKISLTVDLSAGEQEQVVIREIRAEIFDRKRISAAVMPIQCQYGGGSPGGYFITVDTVRSRVTVAPADDLGNEAEMPPATVSLTEAGYTSSRVSVVSAPGYLYSGKVVIDATINGQERTLEYGDATRPLRWSDDSNLFDSGAYDWDLKGGQWLLFADQDAFWASLS